MTFLLTILYSKTANFILSQLFHLAVIVIQKFSKMSMQKDKVSQLGCCDENSIGLAVFHLLKKHHLALIPSYESHDLKHILLGYKMTLMDEILLQFFMLGNGNKSIVCYLIASLGIYFPHQYRIMYSHYIRGKNTKSIVHLTLMENAHSSIDCLREKYKIFID